MIDEKLLQQAIKVLREVNKKHYEDSSKKKPLLEDEKETTLYLQISLKKIPKFKSIQMIKVNLPHSLIKDNSEVCLITGDLDKRNHKAEIEPDVLHYKELLKKHDINHISEVLTLRQLRTEYKPYEAKQKLLAAYDVFLADRKISECLPKVLGRHFFKKRKFPIQITMNTPNLKQQVEKALSTKVFYLTGHGNSCNSEVAHLDMSDAEISKNVIAMAEAFSAKLPGSWNNVMGMYLKTSLSKAVPVYMSFDDPNKVHLEKVKSETHYEIDELSTCSNSLVKVYNDGTVKTVRIKRMAESESEICETADMNGHAKNKRKKKESATDNSVNSLTSTDLEKSTKNKKKSKSKKKEGSILEQQLDENICSVEEKVLDESVDINSISENKKKNKENITDETNLNEESVKTLKKSKSKKMKTESLLEKDADKSMFVMEEKSPEDNSKFKTERKTRSMLKNEVCDSATSSEIKAQSDETNTMSKNKRRSVRNILIREEEKTLISSKLKEELSDVIDTSKGKRKSRKSMLSEANRSVIYSPVQSVKKKEAAENLKTPHSMKRKSKGKQKEENHL